MEFLKYSIFPTFAQNLFVFNFFDNSGAVHRIHDSISYDKHGRALQSYL